MKKEIVKFVMKDGKEYCFFKNLFKDFDYDALSNEVAENKKEYQENSKIQWGYFILMFNDVVDGKNAKKVFDLDNIKEIVLDTKMDENVHIKLNKTRYKSLMIDEKEKTITIRLTNKKYKDLDLTNLYDKEAYKKINVERVYVRKD